MHGNVFVGADNCPQSPSKLQIAVAAKRTSRNTILYSLKLVGQNWRDVAKEESAVAAKAAEEENAKRVLDCKRSLQRSWSSICRGRGIA